MKEEKNWDGIVFYCKDCEKIVDALRSGRRYVYTCSVCKTKNVAFGTKKSIQSYFHVQDESSSASKIGHGSPKKVMSEKN